MYHGEKLNSISHLVGTVLSLMGLGALLTIGIQSGDPWILFSFTVFGISLVLLYTMSTLYHSLHPPRLKRIFKLLDHVAIYLLIAGTYTPYMLVGMRDSSGLLILSVVWGLAAVGILSEIYLSGRLVKFCQMVIFLGMGWSVSFDFQSIEAALPPTGLALLVAGGIAYTGGIVFFILDGLKALAHAHGIWHFFVIAGSCCHFASVIGYLR